MRDSECHAQEFRVGKNSEQQQKNETRAKNNRVERKQTLALKNETETRFIESKECLDLGCPCPGAPDAGATDPTGEAAARRRLTLPLRELLLPPGGGLVPLPF
jgi:hypothetical protein